MNPKQPLISVIIPTAQEEGYIINTLMKLSKQNVWPRTEVIIVDYDPTGRHTTLEMMKRLPSNVKKNIRIMKTTKSGIGFARHAGAVGSKGMYLMSFDADAYFEDKDSIRRLVQPLITSKAIMSYGNISLNTRTDNRYWWYDLRNILQKYGVSTVAHEIGLTMERDAYFSIGGYKDVHRNEAAFLTLDVTRQLGRNKIKFVGDVWVRASRRRIIGGGVMDADYNIAYR